MMLQFVLYCWNNGIVITCTMLSALWLLPIEQTQGNILTVGIRHKHTKSLYTHYFSYFDFGVHVFEKGQFTKRKVEVTR